MLPIFACAPVIGISCLNCCWKKFLAQGGLPADLQKYSKNEKFSLKNLKKCLFSILGGQNRLPVGWEVPDVFLVCHEVLLLTNVDHPRKKFLTRRTPFSSKLGSQKRKFLHFFSPKKSNFWNCCWNFWHKVLPKFLATSWGLSTPETPGDAVSWNSMYYSWSCKFLKNCKIN